MAIRASLFIPAIGGELNYRFAIGCMVFTNKSYIYIIFSTASHMFIP